MSDARIVVITTVHERHGHLRRMQAALATGSIVPDLHVIVAMDDPVAASWPSTAGLRQHIVEVRADTSGLPLGRARNAGAAAAAAGLTDPDDLLIFLDVDCIPGTGMVAAYYAAGIVAPDALLCGPVCYLPPAGPQGYPDTGLALLAPPHPGRPAPPPGVVARHGDHALFWSLSFAVRQDTWDAIGGFDEAYRGYGAEDTDFAWEAKGRGIELCWVGSARAFHQHHPVSDPPVEHIDDILTNGRRFAVKWGHWPMQGWLDAFVSLGLVERSGADYRRPARQASTRKLEEEAR